MATLTAKRKSDRIAMADAVASLAREFGATVTIHPERNREIMVSIETARQLNVTVDIDGAGRMSDTFVLSWHTGLRTDARLSDAFGDINPYHFQKATRVAYDFAGLLAMLRRDLGMIADGSAFDAAREAAGIAEHGTWQQRDAQWAAWRAEEDASRKA